MDKMKQNLEKNEKYVAPSIEVIEIVCQNTPDGTHGSAC